MDEYGRATYGDAFAEVYDDWYGDVSDIAATVARVRALASPGDTVLELGVGTGRLALPLAAAGLEVTGIDASESMLDVLRRRDAPGRVRLITGDMVDDVPDERFDVVLIAYNTLFNLRSEREQRSLFRRVAGALRHDGAFVVEAFVPDPQRDGDRVDVRSLEIDRVVLSVSRHDGAEQRAEGHFVDLVDGAPVRLRPWAIRWATPTQLDEMAAAADLVLDRRLGDMAGAEFTDESPAHVSIYRPRPAETV